MYIRKVIRRNKSSKKYEYLYLVENIRTEKGPRQRLILNLGNIDIPPEQYKELANTIESLLTGQKRLFSSNPVIEKHAQKAVRKIRKRNLQDIPEKETETRQYHQVDLESVNLSESRSFGAEMVCHEFWKRLGFDQVLYENGVPESALPIVEALVTGRLISPGSERHTHYWATQLSTIFELTGQTKKTRHSLPGFYRAGDRLFAAKDALEKHLSQKERELFSLPEKLILLDLTNTYFEGDMCSNAKAARGRSKEKRFDAKLLTLALIIDEHGFPKYSRLYPGNQAEVKTFQDMIQQMSASRPDLAHDRVVIVDKGLASKENIAWLKENDFHYIIISREKHDYSPNDEMIVLKEDPAKQTKIEVQRHEADDEIHLFCRSVRKVGKEQGIRGRQEHIFLERLQYFKDGLSRKHRIKTYEKLLQAVGRLREKYPKAAKLYEVTVTPSNSRNSQNKVLVKDIFWNRKEELYNHALQQEGCYLLRTDLTHLSDKEIWKTYMMLTQVEKAFRSMKASLGVRPNFHQREDRGDTHFFISVLAYHILNSIEHTLRNSGDHRSWTTIRTILSSHTMGTVSMNILQNGEAKTFHWRAPCIPEQAHKEIYRNLDIPYQQVRKKSMIQ